MSGWLMVAVETQAPWCCSDTHWQFDGRMLQVRPVHRFDHGDTLPDVGVQYADEPDMGVALGVVRRFLSSLCWLHRTAVEERAYDTGGFPLFHGGSLRCSVRHGEPRLHWPAQSPPRREQRLAMALYREAMTVNSVPYKFLGFYRILELAVRKGADRGQLIAQALGCLACQPGCSLQQKNAVRRRDELVAMEKSPKQWLYHSCRCAIAHAAARRVIDPDKATDAFRLQRDADLMRWISEYIMKHELGL